MRLGSPSNGECINAPNHLSNFQTFQTSSHDRFVNKSQDSSLGGPSSLPPRFQHQTMLEKNNFPPPHLDMAALSYNASSIPPGNLRGQQKQFSFSHMQYSQEQLANLRTSRPYSRGSRSRYGTAPGLNLGAGIAPSRLATPEGLPGQRMGNTGVLQDLSLHPSQIDANQRSLSEGHRLLAARFPQREDIHPQFKCMSQVCTSSCSELVWDAVKLFLCPRYFACRCRLLSSNIFSAKWAVILTDQKHSMSHRGRCPSDWDVSYYLAG